MMVITVTYKLKKIFILYGDNGSRKTTLLRLLFHLVATTDKSGHKTAIARIPFQKIKIEFNDGFTIWASREQDQLLWSYTLGTSRNKDVLTICTTTSK